METVDRA